MPDAGEPALPQIPLDLLLRAAPDGFVVVDNSGMIVWANGRLAEMLQYEPSELPGRPIEALIPARMRERHVRERSQYEHQPRVRPMGIGMDLIARRSDGSEMPVEISLSPVSSGGMALTVAIVRDVTERKRLEAEREALQMELQTERERERIAMDLHDGIMSDIYAATLTFELAIEKADDPRYADATTVNRGIAQLGDVERNMRSYIFDLRPKDFSGDLPSALIQLASEFRQNSLIETDIDVDATVVVDPGTALALYHISHEALSNVQKHAKAAHVQVCLRRESDGRGLLQISDDGVGFDIAAPQAARHRGTRNMSARAAAVAAQFEVKSRGGKGTMVEVRFGARTRSTPSR